jgi:molecular chaperone DnaK
MEHSRTVGIDLGTTFSAIAVVDEHGKPQIIPNAEGDTLTPSVLLFDDDPDTTVVVGRIAKENAVARPDRVVEFVKREMGRNASEYTRTFDGKTYDAEQLSAFVLRKLKDAAERALQAPVTRAAITVPAYFNDAQRMATKRAGEHAGLEVLRLIDEPVAAAVALMASGRAPAGKFLVFDLGGGTLDVTLVERVGPEMRTVATDGDHQLGGKDWDDRLIAYAAEEFKRKFASDPQDDAMAYQDLQQRAIQAKEALSLRPQTAMLVQHEGRRLKIEISREVFRDISQDLLQRCEFLCGQVLKQANCGWPDVALVLLVGGSTRMPMIQDMLRAISGREPSLLINPDEAVALGAACVAALAGGSGTEPQPDGVTAAPQECVAHSLGTIVKASADPQSADELSIVIPRGQPIGRRYREEYATLLANQTAVRFQIVQGETLDSASSLGDCVLTGIPRDKAGRPVYLELAYDASHILTATAGDIATGLSLSVEITRPGDLSATVRERATRDVAALPVQ